MAAALLASCAAPTNTNTTTANRNTANSNTATRSPQELSITERPQKIKDQMAARGAQDTAQPRLQIVSPADGAVINNSTVKVKLDLSGDLKGYMPHMDPETKMGNHVHVILDNQPYEAYYDLSHDFELRNVSDGEHTLRVFPSRPWHESYKNQGAFQIVRFTVRNGGGDPARPTTTSNGNTLANPTNSSPTPGTTPEGKAMAPSNAGSVDPKRPLLTYSRPKGDYKGDDANAIMIDFWLANAKLAGDGGEYRVRYSVDNGSPKFIDKWEPIWLTGWTTGTHSIKLELVDASGNVVDNGGYNSTTREITVTK
jgi:hypothetical protein